MSGCLKCKQPLPPADTDHRYCPYCGFLRVLPDPPDGGVHGGCLIIGRDVIGPKSGDLYAYPQLVAVPQRLHPLQGPFYLEGELLHDLYPASDAPLPERAWRQDHHDPSTPTDRMVGATLWQVALRHTRLFCLAKGGLLSAYDARTLEFAPGWGFPTLAPVTPHTSLHASETLVYVCVPVPAGTRLWGADVGKGVVRIEFILPHFHPQVRIAGGAVWVIGDVVGGPAQKVERYDLADFASMPHPGPRSQVSVTVSGSLQPHPPAPILLNRDLVFSAADGKLYRWSIEEPEPQMLWPMPLKAEWQQEVIPLGPDRVGFVADAGGKVSMIQVGLSAEGKAELSGILDLPLLAGAPQCCLAAHRDRIFFPVQPPGQHITIYEVSLNAAAGGGVTKLHEIPGVMGAEVRGCAMVPWKGSPHVLIHYHLGLAQHFWLVHPEMGEAHPLGGIPLAAHDVRIRWEQGRVFWINLSEGKIKAL